MTVTTTCQPASEEEEFLSCLRCRKRSILVYAVLPATQAISSWKTIRPRDKGIECPGGDTEKTGYGSGGDGRKAWTANCVLSKEEEDLLAKYMVEMADMGYGLSREDVMGQGRNTLSRMSVLGGGGMKVSKVVILTLLSVVPNHSHTARPYVPTKLSLMTYAGQVWPRSFNPLNVMSGFRNCVIQPFNPGEVSDRALTVSRGVKTPCPEEVEEDHPPFPPEKIELFEKRHEEARAMMWMTQNTRFEALSYGISNFL
ncbi:hypothetical protein GBAR_LOCUS19904 [Geodia barretti]|uniref:Uncharacterized protein n=1 Tax=Geodia barretti TaxID=519541 RepID=A0AA35X2D5_GEOBA|nr:hypothetical protein GBAR_LOCUS19904 [Geodia barretti]